ncbi:inositol monophosphatase family protein [Actinokineospora sp. NPDC004072]
MGESDVDIAIRAAEAGAAIIRAAFGRDLELFSKDGDDFATEADIAAEHAIRALLTATRPNDAVIGEELGSTGDSDRTWLVDPLCGTHNFAAGTPLVAVNVALRVNGTITAAAVADPFTPQTYWTTPHTAQSRSGPLTPTPTSRIIDIDIDPPTPGRFPTAALLADPAFTTRFRPRVLSTSLAAAWVAAGSRAGYITAADTRDSVHFTAAIALCRAAGCPTTDLTGDPNGTNGLIAAADPQTHAALLAAIRAH